MTMRPFVADVHMHSIMSGHAYGTVREMAQAAAERGLRLIGVTEHGPGVPGTVDSIYFRNLPDAPKELYGVEMLYGSEVNILPDGGVLMDERTLKCLDYAVAGIHGFCFEDMGKVKNTDSVIRCMEIEQVRFISHPDNNSYPLDYPALVEGAKACGVALEVNNGSLRYPAMRPGCVENYGIMVPLCMKHGVPIVVNTDAHDPTVVGDFGLARELLAGMDIDEDLILNNDADKMKAFLLKR